MTCSRRAMLPLCAALAIVATPIAASAQSCLGFPLLAGQRMVGFQLGSGFEDGGPGGFYSHVNRANASLQVDWVAYEIWVDGDVVDRLGSLTLRRAQPVWETQTAGTPGNACGVLDVGAVLGGSNAVRVGGGLFYALAGRFGSVYAGPMVLAGLSEDGNSAGMGILAGVSGRLGPVVMGLAVDPPIVPFQTEPTLHLRLGIAWGRAVDRPAAPVSPVLRPTETTDEASSVAAVVAGRAGAASAPSANPTAPTAGLKPYALDDIEAMVKNGVATSRILELSRRACLSFRLTDASETHLRRVGADPELLTGLRQACYTAN